MANSVPSTRLSTSPGLTKPPYPKRNNKMAKTTKKFMASKEKEAKVTRNPRNAPIADSNILQCHWAKVCRCRSKGETRGRQRNRENSSLRHRFRSKDRRNRRRSARTRRREGDTRERSDQFETITFETITVDVTEPQA